MKTVISQKDMFQTSIILYHFCHTINHFLRHIVINHLRVDIPFSASKITIEDDCKLLPPKQRLTKEVLLYIISAISSAAFFFIELLVMHA